MKKMLLSLLGLAFGVMVMGQNKIVNDANAVIRNVAKFNAIDVSSGIELYISQSTTQQVAVSASTPEARDHIQTTVSNGVLKITPDNGWYIRTSKRKDKLRAYVSTADINAIAASSGSQVHINGNLNTNQLKINLSSGSSFDGSIKSAKTVIHQSSGSSALLSGSGEELEVKTGSGAVFNGYDFITKNCIADVSSGAVIETTVNGALTAEASSGGNIRYKGKGNIVKVSTGSGGSINKQ